MAAGRFPKFKIIPKVLAAAGIPERARAEELGLGEFLEIFGRRAI